MISITPNLRRTIEVVTSIAKVTLLELIRDKILYNLLFFAVGLILLGTMASRLTFIQPDRLVLDFGISAMHLAGAAIAILFGATLIPREFERRTFSIALSRPITRAQFVFGKYLGLLTLLFFNHFLWTGIYLLSLGLSSFRGFFFHYQPILFLSMLFLFFHSAVVGALALAFSTWTTASLSIAFTIGFYLIGNSVTTLHLVLSKFQNPVVKTIGYGLVSALPNLEAFNLGLSVVYGYAISPWTVLQALFYFVIWIVVSMFVATRWVQAKEV